MWSVRFKWLYAIFLVVFTLVMWTGILFVAPAQPQQVGRSLVTWVVGFFGVLWWWYRQSHQEQR